jgi:hypothetical protein
VLPPISIHSLGRSGIGEKRSVDGTPLGRPPSRPLDNPFRNHETAWDHNSAAQQLVGLSQEGPSRSGLQHERPVLLQPQPGKQTRATPAAHPVGDGLDLDDLQNFLSWDMYGFMEIGDAVSQNGFDDAKTQSSLTGI